MRGKASAGIDRARSSWRRSGKRTRGAVRVIDFMPPRGKAPDIVRIVEGLRGHVDDVLRARHPLRLRRHDPWVRRIGRRPHRGRRPGRALLSHTRRASRREPAHARRVHREERRTRPLHADLVPVERAAAASDRRGARAGRRRSSTGRTGPHAVATAGKWKEDVQASLAVLKGLTYAPTGGIVAAPTTSLPEKIGGERNWDYRYCWLRDATLTLLAFLNAGYLEEARAWRVWLLRAAAGDPSALQIMYGVAGERRLFELDARLAARLRGLEAGARRQRGGRAVPARRVRRGARRAASGPGPQAGSVEGGVGAPAPAARLPRGRLEASPTKASGRCAARGGTSRTRR